MANSDRIECPITTPESECPHCHEWLVSHNDYCMCPGALAARGGVTPKPEPTGPGFTGKIPECLITIPEKECPHCHASLANEYEQCTCPGSQAQ